MDHVRVLILEDRPADAELMAAELRRAGLAFAWERVDSEREFVARLDPPPDLILADFSMPQFGALRALQILKERQLDIPCIIVSGSIGEEIAVGALRDGAADYLLKDRLARLASAANRALEAKQVRDTRRLAEEELTRERNLLRTLIDSLPDYISVKDLESRFVAVNEAYMRFAGRQHAEELLGKTVFDVFPPHLAARYVADDQQVIQSGRPLSAESETVDRENRTRWHAVTKVPFRNSAGEIVGLVGIARDITERRQTEEKLERQLEAITTLYASAHRLSQSLNLQALVEYAVSTAVKVFGAGLAWIGRAEADRSVRVLGHYPPKSEYIERLTVRWDEVPGGLGPTGRAIRSGFPVVLSDLPTDTNLPAERRDELVRLGFQSTAALPLISRDRPFGALVLYSTDAGFFTAAKVELLQAFANLAAATLENARLFEEAEGRFRQLQALRNIDMAITSSLDLRLTLNIILDQVATHLQVDAANVLLFDPHSQTLRHGTSRGFRTNALRGANLRLGEGYAGRAALERRTIAVPDLSQDPGEFSRSPRLPEEGFVAYYAVPLLAKGEIKGVLEIFQRTPLNPSLDWTSFLEALGGQAAIAIDNSSLFDNLQRANLDLLLAYDTTLEGWSKALDLRDRETEGHTLRVTELTILLARRLGVADADLVHVRRGALLHDIGKMGIPDSILLKPGPLTDEEWVIMKKHPEYANELLAPIQYLRPAKNIPYCHHEKWDGTGYPRGLKEEEIPVAARIFAVVDVYDALTSDRPYRKAWPKEKALAHIRDQAGKHFDARVVEAFFQLEM